MIAGILFKTLIPTSEAASLPDHNQSVPGHPFSPVVGVI